VPSKTEQASAPPSRPSRQLAPRREAPSVLTPLSPIAQKRECWLPMLSSMPSSRLVAEHARVIRGLDDQRLANPTAAAGPRGSGRAP
jgi:hypothetical protein